MSEPLENLNRQKSFELANSCTYYHLRKVDRIIYNFFENEMENKDVSPVQLSLLNAVYLAKKKLGISKLAKYMALDRTTLTRNLKILEKKNLIRIENTPNDVRKRIFYLTELGEKELKKGIPIWDEAHKELKKRISEDLWQKLMEILKDIENQSDNLT